MTIIKTALAAFAVAMMALSSVAHAGDAKTGDGMASMDMKATMVGDLELKGAFARATLPNQPVAGAFLTITNTGTEDDRLISVSSSISMKGEVHEMAMEGETMKMRELADGLVIPAGETVVLKPGGYHLMFMKLNAPLVEGETVDATLQFEKAGSVTLSFAIVEKGAKSMGHSGQGS